MEDVHSTENTVRYLTEEQWDELANKVAEAVEEKGELEPPEFESASPQGFLSQIAAKDDFQSAYELISKHIVEKQSFELNTYWNSLLALGAAYSGKITEARERATKVYTEEPRYAAAYVAMAYCSWSEGRPFFALKWMELAEACQEVMPSRFLKLHMDIDSEVERVSKLLQLLEPVFTDDSKFARLLQLYEVEEDQPLFTEFSELRANPEEMQRSIESSPALLKWFNEIQADPLPTIIYERPDPPAYVPPAKAEETGLEQLTPSIAARIAAYCQDVDLFALLFASKATNALFDRPSVWRALVERNMMPLETIRCPIASYEWKHLHRLYNFVLCAAESVLPLCAPITAGDNQCILLDEDREDELRSLAEAFQIVTLSSRNSTAMAWVFEIAMFLVLLDASPEHRITFTLDECMCLGDIATVFLLPQVHSSSVQIAASNYIMNTLTSRRGDPESVLVQNLSQTTVLRNLLSSGWRSASNAINTLRFQNNFEPDFNFFPLNAYTGTSTFRKKLLSSQTYALSNIPSIVAEEKAEEMNDSEKAVVSLKSMSYPTTKLLNGVYRLYFCYSHPDLSNERDEGVASLEWNEEEQCLEGKGTDTLRGPFAITACNWLSNTRDESLEHASKIPPQRLVLKYDEQDGKTLQLKCFPFAYGFTGEFEYLYNQQELLQSFEDHTFSSIMPEKIESANGGFTLLYDIEATKSLMASKNASSSSSGHLKSKYDELCEATKQRETEKRNERKNTLALSTPYFEPWLYESPDQELLASKRVIMQYSAAMMEMWTEACKMTRVLELVDILPEPMQGFVERLTEHALTSLLPQTELESDLKYGARTQAFVALYALAFEARATLLAQMPAQRVTRAYQILQSDHEMNSVLAQEHCFWMELLAYTPFEQKYHLGLIAGRYEEHILPMMIHDPIDERGADKIRDTITVLSTKGTKKKTASSKSFANTVILASAISFGIAAIGIGAFLVGRALARKD